MNYFSSDEKKKTKFKMKINKYNINSYLNQNKLVKFLQNMKVKNKSNDLKINAINYSTLSLSPKTKRLSPDSKINLSEINYLSKRENTLSINEDENKNDSVLLTNKDFLFSKLNRTLKKKDIKENSELDINQFKIFRGLKRRTFSKNDSNKKNDNIKYKLNIDILPLNLQYQNNLNKHKRRNSLPINKNKIINSNSETDYYETRINKVQTINNIIITEPNIISENSNKKLFKRKKTLRRRNSIYNKLKERNSNKKKNSIFMKELKLSIEKISENEFLVDPLQKKFITKQFSTIESIMNDIKNNKINFSQKLIDKIVHKFSNEMEEKEKILLKKEFSTFLGKEETLKKIYKSLFFQIRKEILKRFLYMVFKSIYAFKKKRRILRSFYTITFPFLLDKYLNPRKGVLSLIFRFGIERNNNTLSKPKRKFDNLRINEIIQPSINHKIISSFDNNKSNFNITNNNNDKGINNIKNDSYSKFVRNFNIDLKKNMTNLFKQNNNVFPEKTLMSQRKNLMKIESLLEKAKIRVNNILYIHEFLSNDTSHSIEIQPLINVQLKNYRAKFFTKNTYKKPIKKVSKMKYRKSSLFDDYFLGNFNGRKLRIVSSRKYIYDNFLTRPKKILKTKKFIQDFKISSNIFSSTNKDITNIKTQLLKALELKGVRNNLYKVIFHYISCDNTVLVKKTINDNYGFMNINYKDEKGYTFLNAAVKCECKSELIQFLLIKGCNPNIPNVIYLYLTLLLE